MCSDDLLQTGMKTQGARHEKGRQIIAVDRSSDTLGSAQPAKACWGAFEGEIFCAGTVRPVELKVRRFVRAA